MFFEWMLRNNQMTLLKVMESCATLIYFMQMSLKHRCILNQNRFSLKIFKTLIVLVFLYNFRCSVTLKKILIQRRPANCLINLWKFKIQGKGIQGNQNTQQLENIFRIKVSIWDPCVCVWWKWSRTIVLLIYF